MRKLMILAAATAGYVLGARAGRERYETIKRAAARVRTDPHVQEGVHQAADLAREKGPQLKGMVTEGAQAAKDKVTGTSTTAPAGA